MTVSKPFYHVYDKQASYHYTCYKCGKEFGTDAIFDDPKKARCLTGPCAMTKDADCPICSCYFDTGQVLCAIHKPHEAKPMTEGNKNDFEPGKFRYDLIPSYALERLAEVYTIGAKKYDDNNWRKGFRWGRIFRALIQHAFAWWKGERDDLKDHQHHLASVAWCAFALMEFEHNKLGEDDRWITPPPSSSLPSQVSTSTSGDSTANSLPNFSWGPNNMRGTINSDSFR